MSKFFLHTNPGTHLRDLGCHQLVADLTAAREGAPHISNIPPEDDENSIYDGEMALQTNPKDLGCSSFEPHKLVEQAPQYIPIFLCNHVNNHLLL